MTTDDIKALISLAILNNKSGVLSAMNSAGYPVSAAISDDALFSEMLKVLDSQGIVGIKRILSKVKIDKTKNTELFEPIYRRLNDVPINAKGKFWEGVSTFFGDLLGGSQTTTTTPSVSTQTVTPAISSKVIIYMAIFGVIAVITLLIIFRK